MPSLVVHVAFGSEYEDAIPLLPSGVAMSSYALLNVLLFYHLGKGEWRMVMVLIAGAIGETLGFALFHGSPQEVLGVSVVQRSRF